MFGLPSDRVVKKAKWIHINTLPKCQQDALSLFKQGGLTALTRIISEIDLQAQHHAKLSNDTKYDLGKSRKQFDAEFRAHPVTQPGMKGQFTRKQIIGAIARISAGCNITDRQNQVATPFDIERASLDRCLPA